MYDSLQSELEASDSGFYNTPLASARTANEELMKRDSHIERTMKTVKRALEQASQQGGHASHKYFPEAIPEDPSNAALDFMKELLESTDGRRTPSPSPLTDFTPTGQVDSREDSPSSAFELLTVGKRLSPRSGNCVGGKLSHAPSTDSLASYAGPALGEPGMPGTRDLEFAIRRLSVRRKVELDYQRFRQAKGYNTTSPPIKLSSGKIPVDVSRGVSGPSGIHSTPTTSKPKSDSNRPKLYKPMEGSRTLKQWKMLATPSLIGSISSVQALSGVRQRASYFAQLRCSTPLDRESTPHVDSVLFSDIDDSPRSEGNAPTVISTPGTFSFVNTQVRNPTVVTSPTSQRTKKVPGQGTACGETSLVWSSNAKNVMRTQQRDGDSAVGLSGVSFSGDSGDKMSLGILTRAELQRAQSGGAQSITVSHYLDRANDGN